METFTNPDFPEVLRRLRGVSVVPYLNFTLKVSYRSIITGEPYCYTTKATSLLIATYPLSITSKRRPRR